MLLPLTDQRLTLYRSGFNRKPYDLPKLVRHLHEHGVSSWFLDQLWGELHHQGDVGEASYAIVPYMVEYVRHLDHVDSQVVAFAYVVEECRRTEDDQGNPDVPSEILPSYQAALGELPIVALSKPAGSWNEDLTRYVASLIALTHGQPVLAKAYQDFTATEAQEWLRLYYSDDS